MISENRNDDCQVVYVVLFGLNDVAAVFSSFEKALHFKDYDTCPRRGTPIYRIIPYLVDLAKPRTESCERRIPHEDCLRSSIQRRGDRGNNQNIQKERAAMISEKTLELAREWANGAALVNSDTTSLMSMLVKLSKSILADASPEKVESMTEKLSSVDIPPERNSFESFGGECGVTSGWSPRTKGTPAKSCSSDDKNDWAGSQLREIIDRAASIDGEVFRGVVFGADGAWRAEFQDGPACFGFGNPIPELWKLVGTREGNDLIVRLPNLSPRESISITNTSLKPLKVCGGPSGTVVLEPGETADFDAAENPVTDDEARAEIALVRSGHAANADLLDRYIDQHKEKKP